MKSYVFIAFLILFSIYHGQVNVLEINQINPDIEFENIHVKKISSNTSSSTFAIWIKKKVKLHKHINHTENILVQSGYGQFQLNDSIYSVSLGDLIIVPKNTWHGVIIDSKEPMKVISIQSPEFFGNDRVYKN